MTKVKFEMHSNPKRYGSQAIANRFENIDIFRARVKASMMKQIEKILNETPTALIAVLQNIETGHKKLISMGHPDATGFFEGEIWVWLPKERA